MWQVLVELVGTILHGAGSTPRKGREGAPPARGVQTANVVIVLVMVVAFVVVVVVGIGVVLANA